MPDDDTYTEKGELSWCQFCHHRWHQRLSLWQPLVPPVMTKLVGIMTTLGFQCICIKALGHQLMACGLFSAMTQPEPKLMYCQLESLNYKIQQNSRSKYKTFLSSECSWKYPMLNGGLPCKSQHDPAPTLKRCHGHNISSFATQEAVTMTTYF